MKKKNKNLVYDYLILFGVYILAGVIVSIKGYISLTIYTCFIAYLCYDLMKSFGGFKWTKLVILS